MTWIVDASVAVKWLVREPGSDAARELIGEELLAPDILIVEVANAAWKKWRRGEIAKEVAQLCPSSAASFVSLVPSAALTESALAIALELQHPVYDCHYLALAEQIGFKLITSDKKLAMRCATSPWRDSVTMLGENA